MIQRLDQKLYLLIYDYIFEENLLHHICLMLLTNTHIDNVLLLVNSTAVELEFNSAFQFNSLQTKQFLSTHLRKKLDASLLQKNQTHWLRLKQW